MTLSPRIRIGALRCEAILVLALVWLSLVGSASAQPPAGNQFGAPSIRRPTTSPYLNLYRTGDPGIDFSLDYQRLVRPEQQWRQYSSGLNTRLGTLQNRVNSAITPDGRVILPGTGHQTSFMNLHGYFSGGATRAPRGAAIGGAPPRSR